MARKPKEKPQPLSNLGALNEQIQNVLEKRYKVEIERDEAYAEHCFPMDEEIKLMMGNLKNDSGTDLKYLNAWYKILKLQWDGEKMEEEDRDRIRDAMRLMFNALKDGDMLDFLNVLETAEATEPEHLRVV